MKKRETTPGGRIKQLREITRLSRRAFALKHGISPGTLQNCEESRYGKLSKKTAEKIAKALQAEGLQCSLEWIAGKNKHTPLLSTEKYDDYLLEQSDILKKAIENNKTFQANLKLFEAAASGRLHEIEHLIENGASVHLSEGADIKSYEMDCNTPLHLAALHGYIDIVKYLLRKKSNVNAQNRKQQTPLHLSVYNGHNEIVQYLINKGAEINSPDNEGDTPLAWAAYRGQLSAIIKLLAAGAHVSTQNFFRNSPLHWAAEKGHTEITHYLIQNGADPHAQNINDKTALDLAINRGQIETVKFLVRSISNAHSDQQLAHE